MKVLVTGSAGFVGFHLVKELIRRNIDVIGIDNLNGYKDKDLKYARLAEFGILGVGAIDEHYKTYTFLRMDIRNKKKLEEVFRINNFDIVINLAACSGVRTCRDNASLYILNNILGFHNVIELCQKYNVNKFIYASSSSVYGDNQELPFKEEMLTDKLLNIYAITKKTDELIAHVYSDLYNMLTIGLRFFTLYGPWCRNDMAIMKFTNSLIGGEEIVLYNNGLNSRDYTYIDDVIIYIIKLILSENCDKKATVYNIGGASPVNISNLLHILQTKTNKKANVKYCSKRKDEMEITYANNSSIENDYGRIQYTSLDNGIESFIKWYFDYYNVSIEN